MRRALHDAGPVLDIGCGRGIVVDYLRRHGIDARGVELGPVAPLASVKELVRGSTDAFELPADERARINTILLLDVIEHLAEPSSFLRRIAEAFPNLKQIVIAVPARPELWSNHDEFYGHHRRYTLAMLEELGATEARYFFRALYPPLWLIAKSKKKREVALTAPRASTRWLHKLIGSLFVLESRVLPCRLPGTSILAILKAAALPPHSYT